MPHALHTTGFDECPQMGDSRLRVPRVELWVSHASETADVRALGGRYVRRSNVRLWWKADLVFSAVGRWQRESRYDPVDDHVRSFKTMPNQPSSANKREGKGPDRIAAITLVIVVIVQSGA